MKLNIQPVTDTRAAAAAPGTRSPAARAVVLLLMLSSAFTGVQAEQGRGDRGPDRSNSHDQRRDNPRDGRHDNARSGPRDGTREMPRVYAPPPRVVHVEPGRWYDGAHGNNRYYPQPGWAVRGAPSRSRVVVWGGVNYRYHDSVWYAPGARGYVVVRPPIGAVIADRPAFFTLLTIGTIAYLYANGTYYRERAEGYEVVPPPVQGAVAEAPAPASLPKFYVYPRMGQSAQQQASDEYDCHQWAVSQTGVDPTAAATGQQAPVSTAQRDSYQRASGACLDGRGYTVK